MPVPRTSLHFLGLPGMAVAALTGCAANPCGDNRFRKDAYVKEMTLAKDPQGWRIVAERTLQKL